MAQLTAAAELARQSKPYPNESPQYRSARTALLTEEIELRRHIERVAALRRQLPPGGVAGNYRFRDEQGNILGLEDMFGKHDTLLTYFWMFGPQRPLPCPMCTSYVGSLDDPAQDISQRIAIAIIGRSPVARQLAFARHRGWRNLVFYESLDEEFARQYRALDAEDGEWPALDVWTRQDKVVRHFWGQELLGTGDPGEDHRAAPDPTPLWNILDLTPAGRGTDWYPQLEYATAAAPGCHR